MGPLLPSRFCVNCYHRSSREQASSTHVSSSVPEAIPRAIVLTKHQETKENTNETMEKQSQVPNPQTRSEALLNKEAPPKSPAVQNSNPGPSKPDRHEVPSEWKSALESAGITQEEMQSHPKEIWGAVTFMLEGLPVMPSRVEYNEALKESVQLMSADPMAEYTLMGKLGEGGAGAVFLVQQDSTGLKFALKKIKPRNEKQRSQILNEIALMELSRHPNILEYYTAYDFGG